MSNNPHNIPDDLAAMGVALTAATAGALTPTQAFPQRSGRTVAVLTHDWDGVRAPDAAWPVVLVRPHSYPTRMISMGQPGERGQDANNPALWLVELHDVISPRAARTGTQIAVSEGDLEAIWAAIDAYWDHMPNRILGGQSQYAGIRADLRFARPFTVAEDNTVHVMAVGMIGTIGNPHPGFST